MSDQNDKKAPRGYCSGFDYNGLNINFDITMDGKLRLHCAEMSVYRKLANKALGATVLPGGIVHVVESEASQLHNTRETEFGVTVDAPKELLDMLAEFVACHVDRNSCSEMAVVWADKLEAAVADFFTKEAHVYLSDELATAARLVAEGSGQSGTS